MGFRSGKENRQSQSEADWTPVVWSQPGDSVQGYLVERKDGIGQNGNSVYVLRDDSGETFASWSTEIMRERFQDSGAEDKNTGKVIVGANVIIKYLGKPQGKRWMDFDVQVEFNDADGQIIVYSIPDPIGGDTPPQTSGGAEQGVVENKAVETPPPVTPPATPPAAPAPVAAPPVNQPATPPAAPPAAQPAAKAGAAPTLGQILADDADDLPF